MPTMWMDVDIALSEVPINLVALTDDTDFKSREESVTYDQAGLDLTWNFVTTAGVFTQTAVTPTDTGGDYDFVNQGNGMYSIEIPASGGASINNDTEGFGWFNGIANGILHWISPVIGFRAAGLNNLLIDSAYSATRALAGTALPDAAAEAAGGLYTRGSGAGQINQANNGLIDADALRISRDATAADNLEATYDGTGYINGVAPATQSAVSNLTSGSAAINTTAKDAPDGFVLTTGTSEANDEDSTHALDGTTHDLEPDGGNTDAYYIFDVGGNGVPVSVTWHGYANTINDSYAVYAYNWNTPGWEQIGTITGTVSSAIVTETFDLTNAHVGTGANIGLVRFRFESSDGTKFATDRITCAYAVVAQSVGYAQGAIWVDSGGTSGAVPYVNGVADNPCPWANALTLNGVLGLNRFHIANGDTVTLDANSDNYSLKGDVWALALANQSISGFAACGASITGVGTGAVEPQFLSCHFGNTTLPPSHLENCGLMGTLTLGSAGDYFLDNCHSMVAGAGTPIIDFEDANENKNLNMRGYFGSVEIRNIGQAGSTDTMSLEGMGYQLILASTCEAATINLNGHFKITDNVAGGFVDGAGGTLNQDARYATPDLVDDIWDEVLTAATHNVASSAGRRLRATGSLVIREDTAQGAGTGTNQIQLDASASAVDGAYDPAAICIVSGTGVGQSRLILEYDGTSKTATVDRDWKVNPDATSEFQILCFPGREHVNEGLAQGGTSSTITLNTLASSDNNAYLDQTVFIRAGTGADQSANITAYNGTTKVATIVPNWITTPDTTSSYVMLPTGKNISSVALAELAADPGATPTERQALMLLYMALRNKIDVTNSAKEIHNNANSVILTKTLTDDGTTYSESKMA